MSRFPWLRLTPFVLLLAVGCAAPAPGHRTWLSAHGGLAHGSHQDRVDRVAAGLCGACSGRDVRVRVLASDDVCAYGWPGGEVYLTRGLVELLDDAEIAAAVAHELGHLVLDGHLRTVASLRGSAGAADVESRADRAGAELLAARGLPPEAMPRMLATLLTSGKLPPHTRRALQRRIELLRAHPNP